MEQTGKGTLANGALFDSTTPPCRTCSLWQECLYPAWPVRLSGSAWVNCGSLNRMRMLDTSAIWFLFQAINYSLTNDKAELTSSSTAVLSLVQILQTMDLWLWFLSTHPCHLLRHNPKHESKVSEKSYLSCDNKYAYSYILKRPIIWSCNSIQCSALHAFRPY